MNFFLILTTRLASAN